MGECTEAVSRTAAWVGNGQWAMGNNPPDHHSPAVIAHRGGRRSRPTFAHCRATQRPIATRYARSPMTTPRARAGWECRHGCRELFEIVGIVVGIFVVYHVVRALRGLIVILLISLFLSVALEPGVNFRQARVASGLGERERCFGPRRIRRGTFVGLMIPLIVDQVNLLLRPTARLHRPSLPNSPQDSASISPATDSPMPRTRSVVSSPVSAPTSREASLASVRPFLARCSRCSPSGCSPST